MSVQFSFHRVTPQYIEDMNRGVRGGYLDEGLNIGGSGYIVHYFLIESEIGDHFPANFIMNGAESIYAKRMFEEYALEKNIEISPDERLMIDRWFSPEETIEIALFLDSIKGEKFNRMLAPIKKEFTHIDCDYFKKSMQEFFDYFILAAKNKNCIVTSAS